jgi:Tol biopolymer transport system component
MRLPVEGGSPLPVVAGPADEHSARPSPTRGELAFVSNEGGAANVFILSLAGGGVRNLHPTTTLHLFAPHWSPDGDRIAVTAMKNDGRGVRAISHGDLADLRVMVFDREGKQLFDQPGAMPDWMPPWR